MLKQGFYLGNRNSPTAELLQYFVPFYFQFVSIGFLKGIPQNSPWSCACTSFNASIALCI